MTTPSEGLPAPFDSDHALRVVGRIAIESARLEFYLAIMRSHIDRDEKSLAADLVRCGNDKNARAIRRAVRARQWLPSEDGVLLDTAITDWASTAAGRTQGTPRRDALALVHA